MEAAVTELFAFAVWLSSLCLFGWTHRVSPK
jgi:hypothetical protein